MQLGADEALGKLQSLCEGELKGVLHSVDYIRGLIFAVSAAPEIPMPEQWLVWAFDQRGQLASTEQADTLTDILMSLLQGQLREMRDDVIQFPTHYTYQNSTNEPFNFWLKGLLAGHSQLETVWQSAWNRMVDEHPEKMKAAQRNLKHCLMMFTTFADVPMAIEQAKHQGNLALVESLPTIFKSLPKALAQYVALSGDLVSYLPDQFETFVQEKGV